MLQDKVVAYVSDRNQSLFQAKFQFDGEQQTLNRDGYIEDCFVESVPNPDTAILSLADAREFFTQNHLTPGLADCGDYGQFEVTQEGTKTVACLQGLPDGHRQEVTSWDGRLVVRVEVPTEDGTAAQSVYGVSKTLWSIYEAVIN